MTKIICEDALKHPKKFWSFVNGNLKEDANQISLREDDTLVTDPQKLASIFADIFSRISVDKTPQGSSYHMDPPITSSYAHEVISQSDIYKAIMKLPLKFSTGIDGIPAFILKGCGDILLASLEHIFNLSIQSNCFPNMWKEAMVVPIYKKGSACDSRNYRPISLLCVLAKLFDMIMHSYLQRWFRAFPNDCQHGFVIGRSVDTNLVSFMDFVSPVVETRGQVDVIYLDLAKAFDRVSHGFLLDKLSILGLSGNLLGWLRSYLSNRTNVLKCNGVLSRVKYPVTCGVPQGSS